MVTTSLAARALLEIPSAVAGAGDSDEEREGVEEISSTTGIAVDPAVCLLGVAVGTV